ncbi:hypothetical protein HY384_02895 [Candidatus Daviesbacteria bacterium]|nr:hypothetical protein [Candidatus Daviesbacteria bacterium]
MPKLYLLLICLSVVVVTAVLTIIFNFTFNKSTSKSEIETAINQAKFLYRQKKQQGEDFSNGPCLSNAILPNWVADIAHSPRQSTDDLTQNQCPSFLEGSAQHFVELDLEGNLIRAK